MKRLLYLCCGLFLFPCCAVSVVNLRPDIHLSQYKKIAVVGFSDASGSVGSGRMVMEICEKNLLKAGFTVLEHTQLEQLLASRNIAASASLGRTELRELLDSAGVAAVLSGRIIQAVPEQGYISGKESRFIAAQVGVEVHLVDTATGETLMSAAGAYDGMNMQTAFEYLIASLLNHSMFSAQ